MIKVSGTPPLQAPWQMRRSGAYNRASTMQERLFVYGTLAPGRSNHHLLADASGTWCQATLRGRLFEAGWGAAEGYPAIRPDPAGKPVAGYLLTSAHLREYWTMLDHFEGDGYVRQLAPVATLTGQVLEAWVYALAAGGDPEQTP